MRRNFLLFIILSGIMITFTNCQEDLTRVVKQEYPNGQEKFVIYYDGEPSKETVAKIEHYYQNGQIRTQENYENGIQQGTTQTWYKDGTVLAKMNYEDGKKQGKYRKNHPSGNPAYVGAYKNNRKEGEWIKFMKNGDTLSVAVYSKGILKKHRKK